MAMSEMQKWQKSIESGKRRIAKRKATKEAIATGKYTPYTGYDDEGFPLPDPPYWFLNLQKAWISNHKLGIKRRAATEAACKENLPDARTLLSDPSAWEHYCRERDITSETKKAVGRPRLPKHMKKESTKIKRSDVMKKLLLSHGITVKSIGQDEFLVEYPDWEFLPNGRLRHRDDQPISVHRFLQDHDLITM